MKYVNNYINAVIILLRHFLSLKNYIFYLNFSNKEMFMISLLKYGYLATSSLRESFTFVGLKSRFFLHIFNLEACSIHSVGFSAIN
jgi:hypothetical protein